MIAFIIIIIIIIFVYVKYYKGISKCLYSFTDYFIFLFFPNFSVYS